MSLAGQRSDDFGQVLQLTVCVIKKNCGGVPPFQGANRKRVKPQHSILNFSST